MKTEIIELVKKFLDEDDWPYRFASETGVFSGAIGPIGKDIERVNYGIFIREREVNIYHTLLAKVPVEARSAAADFLMRANGHIVYGAFNLEMSTGLVSYKYRVSVAELRADLRGAMKDALSYGPDAFLRYGGGLFAVMHYQGEPEKMIRLCEVLARKTS